MEKEIKMIRKIDFIEDLARKAVVMKVALAHDTLKAKDIRAIIDAIKLEETTTVCDFCGNEMNEVVSFCDMILEDSYENIHTDVHFCESCIRTAMEMFPKVTDIYKIQDND